MLFFYGLILYFVVAAFFLAGCALWTYAAARQFREPRSIICPETLCLAEVVVDGDHAARTGFAGHTEYRLVTCSRWPEREGCDQACAMQVPLVGDDRALSRFAPFALEPRFLRINNPVRMTSTLYAKVSPEFERYAAQARS